MSKRIGRQTVLLEHQPRVLSWASAAGKKEHDGPYGKHFDLVLQDELNGKKSFEAAEQDMLETAIHICIDRAGNREEDIQLLLAGDLLNQIVSAGYTARNLQIPYLGLYGACSTMAESLLLGSMLADGGYADRIVCATCSHFCTAERQYRMPLEMGTQRTPTAQWTVTGAGAVLLGRKHESGKMGVRITHATCGKVIDMGITDQNNMGAAMAPAAADTICTHFRDLGRNFSDYDLIVTGDLGKIGRRLTLELMEKLGIDVQAEKLFDCGCEIYAPDQDTHAGGSGCGCSACMLGACILPKLLTGELKSVLFVATGALLSPTICMQGESIPGIAQAVVFEHAEA